MSRVHCLLDTNALIKRYKEEEGSNLIEALFEHPAAKHFLNVCIPEIIATFFSFELQGEITKDERNELKDIFIQDIREYNIIIHDVKGKTIRQTDEVHEISFQVPRPTYTDPKTGQQKVKPAISAIDALVLSAALELKGNYDRIFLFTSDGHMKEVAKRLDIIVKDVEKMRVLSWHI